MSSFRGAFAAATERHPLRRSRRAAQRMLPGPARRSACCNAPPTAPAASSVQRPVVRCCTANLPPTVCILYIPRRAGAGAGAGPPCFIAAQIIIPSIPYAALSNSRPLFHSLPPAEAPPIGHTRHETTGLVANPFSRRKLLFVAQPVEAHVSARQSALFLQVARPPLYSCLHAATCTRIICQLYGYIGKHMTWKACHPSALPS